MFACTDALSDNATVSFPVLLGRLLSVTVSVSAVFFPKVVESALLTASVTVLPFLDVESWIVTVSSAVLPFGAAPAESGRLSFGAEEGVVLSESESVSVRETLLRMAYASELPKMAERMVAMFT